MNQNSNCISCGCKNKNTFLDYAEIFLLFILIFFIYQILSVFDIQKYFLNFTNNDFNNFSLFAAFILGLVSSFSTCLVVLIGIVLSISTIGDQDKSFLNRIIPHLYFHAGRIIFFFTFGCVLGFFGSFLKFSDYVNSLFTILIGILMLVIGLNILNVIPSLFNKFNARFINKINNYFKDKNNLYFFIIGAITFFVPCGFTQSMQLFAINSGDVLFGGLIMLFFVLGSVPVLFAVGVLGSSIISIGNDFLHKLIGVIIVSISFYLIYSGIILNGFHINFFDKFFQNKDADVSYVNNDLYSTGIQIIKMDVDNGFMPSKFYVKKDIPVRFEISGVNVNGCISKITIPKFNVSVDIQKDNVSIIEFIPKETGVIPFSCWMGMVHGEIIVVE